MLVGKCTKLWCQKWSMLMNVHNKWLRAQMCLCVWVYVCRMPTTRVLTICLESPLFGAQPQNSTLTTSRLRNRMSKRSHCSNHTHLGATLNAFLIKQMIESEYVHENDISSAATWIKASIDKRSQSLRIVHGRFNAHWTHFIWYLFG